MRVRAFAAAILAASFVAAASAQAEVPRQYGSLQFTTTKPGTPTGSMLHVWFQNPTDPTAKPYAVQNMIIYRPPGTVIDTTVPPQCHATDAEIYLQGWNACPADTQLGSGLATSDNGPNANPRYGHSDLKQFNNQDEIVGIGITREDPKITTIDRTKIDSEKSTSTFPLFPGFPPPEPYTPVSELYITFAPYVRNGKAYTTTPAKCPKSRYWTFRVDFVYRDGVTQTLTSNAPCSKS